VIDEDRTRSLELHVVRRRIGEGETGAQRFKLKVQMEQGCPFEQLEWPLIGVADERQAGMLQHVGWSRPLDFRRNRNLGG
jgi:hypothetical protein